jgi:hypothetical protein
VTRLVGRPLRAAFRVDLELPLRRAQPRSPRRGRLRHGAVSIEATLDAGSPACAFRVPSTTAPRSPAAHPVPDRRRSRRHRRADTAFDVVTRRRGGGAGDDHERIAGQQRADDLGGRRRRRCRGATVIAEGLMEYEIVGDPRRSR